MKVFISWSGERSKAVASALRDWLPMVIQKLKPWMSDVDIQAGTQWQTNVAGELEKARIGIFCVTADNHEKPWMVFEAGALSKTISDPKTRVIPFLLDHETPTDLQGPLSQFQVVLANEDGARRVLKSINAALGDEGLQEAMLERAFSTWWPDLDTHLREARQSLQTAPERASEREMIQEVLQGVRAVTNSVAHLHAVSVRRQGPTLAQGMQEHVEFCRSQWTAAAMHVAEKTRVLSFAQQEIAAATLKMRELAALQRSPEIEKQLDYQAGYRDGIYSSLREREADLEKASRMASIAAVALQDARASADQVSHLLHPATADATSHEEIRDPS